MGAVPRPWEIFLEDLGRFAAGPREALEAVAQNPRLGPAAAVAALAAFGRALTRPLPWEQGALAFIGGLLGSFAGALAFWVFYAAVVHGISYVSGKRGDFRTFLALTGWAGIFFWAQLPFRLAVNAGGSAAVAALPRWFCAFAVLGTLWWAMRRVYGWSALGATAVFLVPLSLLGAAITVAGIAAALMANAALLKSLLP